MVFLLLAACFTDGSSDSGADTDVTALEVGLEHRATAVACETERPATTPADARCGTDADDTCTAHEDCTDGANGRCVIDPSFFECACRYDECTRDEDCGATAVCGCAGVAPLAELSNNTCLNGDCRVDADCASGLCLADRWACGSVQEVSSLHVSGWHCATEADTCRGDDVCSDPDDFCVFGQEDAWSCSTDYSITCE